MTSAIAFPSRLAVLIVLASALALPTGALGAAAGGEQEWTPLDRFDEEIAVELVEVEVWVTDRRGRPVPGLERDDFVLLEDGEPVEIVSFSPYEPAEPGDGSRPAVSLGSSTVSPPPSHLGVVIDDWNLRPADRARVIDDLRPFLDRGLPPGTRVALFVNDRSLRMVERFTDDPRRLSGALDRIERAAPQGLEHRAAWRQALVEIREAYEQGEQLCAQVGRAAHDNLAGATVCGEAEAGMSNAVRSYCAAASGRAQAAGGALATTSQVLAGLPGRRALLYVGGGLPQTPGLGLVEYVSELCPGTQSRVATIPREFDLTWLYDEVVDRANAHGVSLYTLDSQGAQLDSGIDRFVPGGSKGPRFTPSTKALRVADADRRAALGFLASRTGGRAILNAADFAPGLARMAADLRSSYSLAFSPDHPADGSLHRLEVRVVDRPVRVRHREAYRFAPVEERLAERVRGVAQLGGGVNPLGVRIEVGESIPEELSYRVPLRLWVPLSRLTLLAAEGDEGLRGGLRVLLTTTDAHGDLVPVRQKLVPVTVRSADASAGREHLVEVDLELAPGEHTIGVGVRDFHGGETSYLRQQLRVPPPAVLSAKGGEQ